MRAALHTAAQTRGVSDGELARRLISRGLAIDGSNAQALVLAEAVRAVVRDELRPTRRLAFLAAFESAAAHEGVSDVLGTVLVRMGRIDRSDAVTRVERSMAHWARHAARRVRDPEPADPDDDAPAEVLPGADDVVEIADDDTARMVEGE